jgi:hypothetical protein
MASENKELGYFGNIWVRQHILKKANDEAVGHTHKFDHVTMLGKGRIRVDVQNNETKEKRSKEFESPTFVIIRKDHSHTITALTDDVQYYCVFALRDIDGEVTDVYSGDNDPYSMQDDDYWIKKKLEDLDKATSHDDD